MIEITTAGAVLAGLLSFLSPCILPMVPFYLAYLGGLGARQVTEGAPVTPALRARAVLAAILFAAGILTVFVALGASASMIGQALRDWFDLLRWVAAALLVAMGLHFLGVLRIGPLNRQWRGDAGAAGLAGAYVAGLVFAFGWTPCVGPVLAAILLLAAGTETAGDGVRLLTAYGAGMTLPFILAAGLIGPAMRLFARLRPHLRRVEAATGLMLVAFGVLIATGGLARLGFWLYESVGLFQQIG